MIYAIWLSFQEVSFFGGFKTAYVGFANYEDALLSRDFWWSTLVTLRFAVLSVVLSIGIGLGLAMLMHRAGRLRAILGRSSSCPGRFRSTAQASCGLTFRVARPAWHHP
jgi:ABC-type sugar transport system permease subunit